MKIRSATESDLAVLATLNRDVQELHVSFRPSVFKSTDTHDMTNGLADLLHNDNFRTFLAEEDGAGVGYAIVKIRRRAADAFKHARNSILIIQIAVAPAYRRKGVASALLDHIRSFAQSSEIERLEVDVYSVNKDARAFYASQGFDTFIEMMEAKAQQDSARYRR
jgi:GNAT superfamily N-acetyltransferase